MFDGIFGWPITEQPGSMPLPPRLALRRAKRYLGTYVCMHIGDIYICTQADIFLLPTCTFQHLSYLL